MILLYFLCFSLRPHFFHFFTSFPYPAFLNFQQNLPLLWSEPQRRKKKARVDLRNVLREGGQLGTQPPLRMSSYLARLNKKKSGRVRPTLPPNLLWRHERGRCGANYTSNTRYVTRLEPATREGNYNSAIISPFFFKLDK